MERNRRLSLIYFCRDVEEHQQYPSTAVVPRKATRSYTFKNTNVTIPKHFVAFISILAIYRDPDIYPNLEVFNSENFSKSVVQS